MLYVIFDSISKNSGKANMVQFIFSPLLRAFQWLNIILWIFLIFYKFCIICSFKTSSFICYCHLFHCVHTGLLIIIINSSLLFFECTNFCLRVFFLCLKHSSFYITVSLLLKYHSFRKKPYLVAFYQIVCPCPWFFNLLSLIYFPSQTLSSSLEYYIICFFHPLIFVPTNILLGLTWCLVHH